jgi:glycosyltransferase domain-containing protein
MSQQRLEEWFTQALNNQSKLRGNLSRLEKLTVVIPSYKRQDFLLRQAVYWCNDVARVVIVDGSPQPLSTKVQEALSSQTNIKYLHSPETVLARLRLAAQHIHTPYAVMLGDDEFILKKGLCQAIDKLDRDSTLVACIGQSLAFSPSRNGAKHMYSKGYPHWRYEVTQGDVRGRLMFAMMNYNAATCYAVLREPVWRRSWVESPPWSYLPTFELRQAIVTYIHGKLSTVDEVYWLRSNENPSVKIESEWDSDELAFEDWWLSSEFKLERERFVEVLAGEVVSTGQLGFEDARKLIVEVMDLYLKQAMKSPPQMSVIGSLKIIAIRVLKTPLKALLPEKQFFKLRAKCVRSNYGGIDDLKRSKNFDSFLLDEDLVSELSEIESIVDGFYKARLAP